MTWDDLHFLPKALHSLLKVSWGIDQNLLSLCHEKTIDLLSDCHCILISIQAIHMFVYNCKRTSLWAAALSFNPSIAPLGLSSLSNTHQEREDHKKEASVKHSALRSAQEGFQTWILLHQGTFELMKGDTNFILNSYWMG